MINVCSPAIRKPFCSLHGRICMRSMNKATCPVIVFCLGIAVCCIMLAVTSSHCGSQTCRSDMPERQYKPMPWRTCASGIATYRCIRHFYNGAKVVFFCKCQPAAYLLFAIGKQPYQAYKNDT